MKLTTKHDVQAPLDYVFARLTDFGFFERLAVRRGAVVERIDAKPEVTVGSGWRVKFSHRGKERKVVIRVMSITPDSSIVLRLESSAMEGEVRLDLLALSQWVTRVALITEIRPRSLAARLLVQSLKLARGRVQRKYDKGGAKLAAMIEEQWQASRGRHKVGV